ncbi:DUF3054 domain-containing protein [Galactobacter caseinivorans]|uniref:DUF3054 domain-containing protein n=1 Tax=Galactobacter caseinivorans TaxID=2676123 RepID=A0A496PL48_9MICC|nr:DUF3054 domain-containing protein [Galactobacter caseinivorans]RKW71135.1 DUF3054 domain-containing protein [Galactobacter caseinivorans]
MRRYSWLPWFALDIVLVIVFAASGRASHEDTASVLGTLNVAWPFLVALVIGTVLTKPWKTINEVWPWGLLVWLITVLFGMALRVLTGGGFALAFLFVTLGILGLFLLGRRAVAGLLIRNRVKLRG